MVLLPPSTPEENPLTPEMIRWTAANPITGERTPPRASGYIQYASVDGLVFDAERDIVRGRWNVTASLAHLSPHTPLQTYTDLYALPAWPEPFYMPLLAKREDPSEGLDDVSAVLARRTNNDRAWNAALAAWITAPTDFTRGPGYWLTEAMPGYVETHVAADWFGDDVNRVAYAQRYTLAETSGSYCGWIVAPNDGRDNSAPIPRKPDALTHLRLLTEETIAPWLTRARAALLGDSAGEVRP